MQISKMFSYLASLCLASVVFTAPVEGNDYQNFYPQSFMGNPPFLNNSECGSCGPCFPAPDCNLGYNPPAYNHCENLGCEQARLENFFLRVDFLWWKPNADGIALGRQEFFTQNSDSNPITQVDHTSIKEPKFKFDPGFRLGFGFNNPCCCWDLAFNWTHFHSKATANGFSDTVPYGRPGDGILPTVPGTGSTFVSFWDRIGQFPETTFGKWTLDMDLLDLEIGHQYYVSKCLVLRPFVGLRGVRIHQNYRVFSHSNLTSTRGVDIFNTPSLGFDTEVKAHNHSLAIGPRIGVDIDVKFDCDVSLFGQVAFASVYGSYDRSAKQLYHDHDPEDYIDFQYFDYSQKGGQKNRFRNIIDLELGLQWDNCVHWCNRTHPVSLAVGWEFHTFYEFSDFSFGNDGVSPNFANGETYTPAGRHTGSLYTQGLTVSATFGF